MRRYRSAGKLGSNIRVNDIVWHLDKRVGENWYVQAKFVVDTLKRYMSSADELITTAHVPDRMRDKNGAFKPIDHSVKMVKHQFLLLLLNFSVSIFSVDRLGMFWKQLEWGSTV